MDEYHVFFVNLGFYPLKFARVSRALHESGPDPVGTGQDFFEISRVGSGWVGSGRVGSGLVGCDP